MKSFFNGTREYWRRHVPLIPKALIVLTLIGFASWEVLDYIQAGRVESIFRNYLISTLEQQARLDRSKLDDFLREHNKVAKLFVHMEDFRRYIGRMEQAGWPASVEVKIYRQRPPWMPPRSFSARVNASYILLLGPELDIHEVYEAISTPLPPGLMKLVPEHTAIDGESYSLEFEGAAYLITPAILRDAVGNPRAFLAFVSTMNEQFMVAFRHQTNAGGIVSIVNTDNGRIQASTRPDLIPAGTPLKSLYGEYLIQTEHYFDFGYSSDMFIDFASLTPKRQVANVINDVISSERTQKILTALVLVLGFALILLWISRQVQQVTQGMMDFTRHQVGKNPGEELRGDQLVLMREQFDFMAEEISLARKRERQRTDELKFANTALQKSLQAFERAQAELLQAEKLAALGGLVAGVAHEINTPLGVGLTAASFLEQKTGECIRRRDAGQLEQEGIDTYLQVAEEASGMILANLSRAADQVRSFKQIAVDQVSEERRVFNLKAYLHDVLRSLRPKLKRTRHTVRVNCPDILELYSYPGALSQILTNLLVNSLNHGFGPEESGEIALEASKDGADILLRYRDNGKGISGENLAKIFEPFFTTRRTEGGSGLGLHIVYNLVNHTLGGSIECTSMLGNGTSFHIRLPAELRSEALGKD